MLNDFRYRLRALFRRGTMETELDEELRAHVEHQADKYVRSGLSREEALRRARLELGGLDQVKEECRDARGVTLIENTIKDLRYGLRMLGKNPVFAAVAVLTLALGIGANTAIFSLLDAVMLRFLPVEKPEELVQIMRHSPRRGGKGTWSFTNPIWEQIRDQQDLFSGMMAWGNARFDLARDGEAHYVKGLFVSGDFFRTLGVRPAIGRLIDRSDDRRGGSGVAVLSYSFWQDHYGGSESVVRSTIWLGNNSYPIIGVAAPGFNGLEVGSKFDVALPLSATEIVDGNADRLEQRSYWWLRIMARLKPGITPENPKARLELLSPRIFSATIPGNWDPEGQKDYLKTTLSTTPASTGTSGLKQLMEEPLQILMAVVGLVLLVACANLAGLMLARSAARNQELALRRALGAGRGRLIRQLLTECLMLSMAGALVGIVFARWGAMLLVRFVSTAGNQVFLDLSYNWRTLAFT
ncbi:MAG: FtsX-like permease family protein, partial [Acidobacteria bacterium]